MHDSAISIDELWLNRACITPQWMAVILQLRSLREATDNIMERAPAHPMAFRIALARTAQSGSHALLPIGTPEDVRGKNAWEILVPKSYSAAVIGPHASAWQASMGSELQSLLKRGKWAEGYVPPEICTIATRWLSKLLYYLNSV